MATIPDQLATEGLRLHATLGALLIRPHFGPGAWDTRKSSNSGSPVSRTRTIADWVALRRRQRSPFIYGIRRTVMKLNVPISRSPRVINTVYLLGRRSVLKLVTYSSALSSIR